jgi:Dolichyl-phosphate-mannose-protein mannosyltransferase
MKNKNLLILFTVSLIVRLLFCFAMPFIKVRLDEQRYDILSDQIIQGNYDLDVVCFICAPFTPYFIALIKLISINYWQELTFVLQSLLSAITALFLYKLTDLLFKNKQIATIAAWFFCFYPMTFYYVKNIGQETAFQSFLIISIYFLIKFRETQLNRDLIISAIVFILCFMTKSFILFWSPFIVLFIFRIKELNVKEKIKNALIFGGLCLISTLPFGLFNLQKHQVYTFSSDGLACYFWFGNSEFAYQRECLGKRYIVNKSGVVQDTAMLLYNWTPPNVTMENFKNALTFFPSEQGRQAIFKRTASTWIEQNPTRFVQLKVESFFHFFMWGLNFRIHPLSISLISVIIFAPLYLLAYLGIYHSLKDDFEKHNWVMGLMITMLLFSIIFTFDPRFRRITLEPFYIIYAAFAAYYYVNKLKWAKLSPLQTKKAALERPQPPSI